MTAMEYTYQDYLEVLETNSETQLIQFVLNAIQEHKRSEKYEIAVIADEYFRHLNRTIIDYQKLLYRSHNPIQVVVDCQHWQQ